MKIENYSNILFLNVLHLLSFNLVLVLCIAVAVSDPDLVLRGRAGFLWLALSALLPSAALFLLFFTQNKEGGASPRSATIILSFVVLLNFFFHLSSSLIFKFF